MTPKSGSSQSSKSTSKSASTEAKGKQAVKNTSKPSSKSKKQKREIAGFEEHLVRVELAPPPPARIRRHDSHRQTRQAVQPWQPVVPPPGYMGDSARGWTSAFVRWLQ
jgi:hypothetical protein